MTKRKITPHKGGRFNQMKMLATDEIRQFFDDIKAKTDESGNDVFERLVRAEWERLFSGQMPLPSDVYREVGKTDETK